MPKDEFPGVFVEEVSFRARPIEGVSTSGVAFVGFADAGANIPTRITGFGEYCAALGEHVSGYLHHAVQGFFENGGGCCYVLGLPAPNTRAKSTTGKVRSASSAASSQKPYLADVAKLLAPLEELKDVSIVCCPDEHAIRGMTGALVAHCEKLRDRITILAAALGSDLSNAPPRAAQSSYAAYYAPWVKIAGPKGSGAISVHPGGHVAGAIVANDARRGVYKAPANIAIKGLVGLERNITARQQDALNPRGVNVLRKFPSVAFGSGVAAQAHPIRRGSTLTFVGISFICSNRLIAAHSGWYSSRTVSSCGATYGERLKTSCLTNGSPVRCRATSQTRLTSFDATAGR